MSRDKTYQEFEFATAAASAGSVSSYHGISSHAADSTLLVGNASAVFVAEGFYWWWEGSEGNVDNTFDGALAYTTDGTNFTAIHTNANPNGFLDTSAALVVNTMKGDAAISGGAAVSIARLSGSASVSSPFVRVPANAIIRWASTTAGTSTAPKYTFVLYGHWV